MKKILVLENVDHLEQRFRDYLLKNHKHNEIDELYSIQSENAGILMDKIFTEGLTDLMMESTFSNIDQLLKLAGSLVKFKDKISFRRITVMYTYNKFDKFLNKLIRKDEAAKTILEMLFDIYEVRTVEWEVFEEINTDHKYIKKLHHFFDTVNVEKHKFSDGDFMFEYERSAVVDPRKRWRSDVLIPFKRFFFENDHPHLDLFINEVEAMLLYQQELIMSDQDNPDHERNKSDNEANLNTLKLLKSTFILTKFQVEDEKLNN